MVKKEKSSEVGILIRDFVASKFPRFPFMPLCEYEFKYQITHTIKKSAASALAITPEGNIISGTCYRMPTKNCFQGRIVLRDHTGQYIKTLVNEPASGLAVTPEGNIISSTFARTYSSDNHFFPRGKIVLRDSNGQYIKTW